MIIFTCILRNINIKLLLLLLLLEEVTLAIEGSSWKPYGSEQREDVLYDFDRAQSDILLWKARIGRSINQEEAKQDALSVPF